MRIKGFRIGRSKKEPEKAAAKEDNATGQIAEMEENINGRTKDLEDKTQQLQELSEEAANTGGKQEDKETPAGPHGPLDELTVEPEDKESDGEEIPASPHGPIDELSVEPEDKLADIDEGEAVTEQAEGSEAEVKVVEVGASGEPAPEGETEPKVVEASASGEPAPEGETKPKVAEASASGEPAPEGEKEAKVDDIGADSIKNLFDDEDEEENPLENLIKVLPDVTARELVDDLEEIQGIIKEWQKG